MRVINDTPKPLRDMDFAIAQLRHLYTHLRREGRDGLANGLLSPEIARLERLRAQ